MPRKIKLFLCFTSEQSEQEENRCAKGRETSSKLYAGKSQRGEELAAA